MSSSIKVENLPKEVMKYLTDYVEDIEEGVEEVTDKVCKEAVTELKQTSPKRQGKRKNPYYRGWTSKKEKKRRKYIRKIHNKTNYQLTHLLENGHATRNGGRTKAQPHIKPVEEKYNKLYEQEIKKVITRRSKA